MKILYVDQAGQLAGGELNLYDYLRFSKQGASVVLFENGPFKQLLEGLGIAVTVIALSDVAGVRRSSNLWALLRVVPTVFSLRKRLAKIAADFDVLYANSQKAFLLACLARRKGQPLIWHMHDILVPEHFGFVLRKLAVTAGNLSASVVIVNSEATARAYIAAGGDAAKVRIVYCGLDASLFDNLSAAGVRALRSDAASPQSFVVGVFGRLAEWKGQHVLLEAIAQLPGVEAMIVGDAFFGEDAYKQRLVQRASQPDLKGRIHFLGFRKDVPELMLASDAIVHTSTAPEPFGRVVVEGMLAGKPVIATRAGGTAEIIVNNVSGLLTTPGSVAELAYAIERLRTEEDLASRLAHAGRERAQQNFSVELMVRRIQEIIEEVTSP